MSAAGRATLKKYNIPAGVKNVDVRKAQICVIKLLANSSNCGVFECTTFPLQRVTTVVNLANTENIFRRASWEFGKQRYYISRVHGNFYLLCLCTQLGRYSGLAL
jgi:hypothetical protein